MLQGVLAVAEACGMENLLKAAGVEYQAHRLQLTASHMNHLPLLGAAHVLMNFVPDDLPIRPRNAGPAQTASADQLRHQQAEGPGGQWQGGHPCALPQKPSTGHMTILKQHD